MKKAKINFQFLSRKSVDGNIYLIDRKRKGIYVESAKKFKEIAGKLSSQSPEEVELLSRGAF